MSPQILVTGATGFIGRQLTRDLVAQGGAVRVLARDRRKARTLFGDTVEIIPGALKDDGAVERACRGAEIVYHIAGSYRFGLRHRHELWRTNVEGTEALLGAAAKAGVGRVVHLSSGGVLTKPDHLPAATLLDETHFPARAPRLSAYKASKWHAERLALAWARRGLPVMIASTTCPIGHGDDLPTPTGRMILDFLQGRFPFYCRTGLNFIHIEDLSRGLQLVAEEGRPGERYLLSHDNLWLKEFLDLLARETGLSAPGVCLPATLIRLIGCGGELADLLNPSSRNARVCLETALQSGRVQFFSHDKARTELGWDPVHSIQRSIRDAVNWFRHVPETAPLEVLSSAPATVAPAPAPSSVGSHVR
jgi:dihydroflavonol-4-reductase